MKRERFFIGTQVRPDVWKAVGDFAEARGVTVADLVRDGLVALGLDIPKVKLGRPRKVWPAAGMTSPAPAVAPVPRNDNTVVRHRVPSRPTQPAPAA